MRSKTKRGKNKERKKEAISNPLRLDGIEDVNITLERKSELIRRLHRLRLQGHRHAPGVLRDFVSSAHPDGASAVDLAGEVRRLKERVLAPVHRAVAMLTKTLSGTRKILPHLKNKKTLSDGRPGVS